METIFHSYALLGSGRLARHLQFYLKSLKLPFTCWSRNGDPDFNSFNEADPDVRLRQTLAGSSHILVAVSDTAIESLAKLARPNQVAVHFSGAIYSSQARGAHPLMTFGAQLQSPEFYRSIPFVIDAGETFANLLPGLPNTSYSIAGDKKPLYHALCSLAGNSTFSLWQLIGDQMERELNLPRSLLTPFLHQVVDNAAAGGTVNFTGPLARGDWAVVRTHLQALQARPELNRAYKTYLRTAQSLGVTLPEGLA